MHEEDAAPMIIPEMHFDTSQLTNEQNNKKFLLSLENKATKKIVGHLDILKDKNTPVYKTGDGKQGYYFVASDNKIVVLIQYKASRIKGLGNLGVITQIALWKNDEFVVMGTFSSNLFFDIVLKDNGAVLSDSHQTRYGMDFWKRRLSEALTQRNKKIVYWDSNTGEFTEVKERIELDALFRLSWSTEKFASKLRWVVID